MQEQYEATITEMKRSRIEEISDLTQGHKIKIDEMNRTFEERLMAATEEVRNAKEKQIEDLINKNKAELAQLKETHETIVRSLKENHETTIAKKEQAHAKAIQNVERELQ